MKKKMLIIMTIILCLSCSENGNENEGKNIEEPQLEIENIQLNLRQLKLVITEEEVLKYVITPAKLSSESVFWSSSDSNIASVDENGKVKAIAIGNAVISVETDNGKTDYCSVSVISVLVKEITLDKTTLNFLPEGKAQLTANVKPDNAANKDVVWISGDENVATVIQQGKVIAIGIGTTTISAINEASGVEANCIINVKKIEDFITLIFGYAGCVVSDYMVTGRLLSSVINNSPEPIDIKSVSITPSCYDIKVYGEMGVYQPGSGLNAQFSLTNAYRPTVTWVFVWKDKRYSVSHTVDMKSKLNI